MNYIILNNKKSTDIRGLLIQTLPPITKPPKKTIVEQIDGKDGDIITELGYSAYNKEINIGLSLDYDTDEVIGYFDSEGTVTFSNEPDKVYKYKIYEQIDFNALLRFKTATVKMHIQPFKYLANENVESLVLDGVTEQNGELITTTTAEINVVNQGNTIAKPTITIYGKNTIRVYLNSVQAFEIELGDNKYITIDTEKMEAYKDSILKNRLVAGDYDNFILNKGTNTITFEGAVEKVEISNYSRWI